MIESTEAAPGMFRLFANPKWKLGSDGSPIHVDAKADCRMCHGFGVVEDSELSIISSVLVDCPICIKAAT